MSPMSGRVDARKLGRFQEETCSKCVPASFIWTDYMSRPGTQFSISEMATSRFFVLGGYMSLTGNSVFQHRYEYYHQPADYDQIAFFSPWIRTGLHRNPATCGTNQGNRQRRFALALRAGGTATTGRIFGWG